MQKPNISGLRCSQGDCDLHPTLGRRGVHSQIQCAFGLFGIKRGVPANLWSTICRRCDRFEREETLIPKWEVAGACDAPATKVSKSVADFPLGDQRIQGSVGLHAVDCSRECVAQFRVAFTNAHANAAADEDALASE